ncbi:unnamed protein product [Rotaria sp. Silwood1]|nr:unnamed protein product [Rotaria sp. Silwood1]
MDSQNSVETLTIALIDTLSDKNEKVRDNVAQSIVDTGKKLPQPTVKLCTNYLDKHQKLPDSHRAAILRVIQRILNYHQDKEGGTPFDSDTFQSLTRVTINELTMPKELIPLWQQAASDVLVEIGKCEPDLVCTALLPHMQAGQLPQFFVLQTVGSLAEANPRGMVHQLRPMFSRILPMMGMIKQENYRWVYTAVLYKFCLALIDFQANGDEAARATFAPQQFENDAFAAYEVFLTSAWIGSKEIKVRNICVQAIGRLVYLFSSSKFTEQFPRLIQNVLGFYRKTVDHLYVSETLNSVVLLAHQWNVPQLKQSMDIILREVLNEIQINYDTFESGNEHAIKNQNELLRTLSILGKHAPQAIWPWLLQRMEQAGTNDKARIVLLVIYRHLVYAFGNDAPSTPFDYKSLLVSSLRPTLNTATLKITKYLSQLIVAMACHGYLQLEGRTFLIEYIVRNCTYPLTTHEDNKTDSSITTTPNADVRIMCRNILNAFSSTIAGMDEVLWPLLMEFLIPEMYTGAFGIITKALAQSGQQQITAKKDTFWVDFELLANLPKPNDIITRCFVLLGEPLVEETRGISILNFLRIAVTELKTELRELWEKVIPRLLQNLNDDDENKKFDSANWQDLMLKFLSKTLDVVEQEDWISDIGACFVKQLPLYIKLEHERGFAYKCIGIVLRKSKRNEFVTRTLESMMTVINFQHEHERNGWATMFGFCSTTHLDIVLQRLDMYLKIGDSKSSSSTSSGSSGLFGFLSSKTDTHSDLLRATTLLAYAYVSIYATLDLIISRMETSILINAVKIARTIKDETGKLIVAKSFVILAQSMNKNHLKTDFVFASRNDLIQEMNNYITQETNVKLQPTTFNQCVRACHALIILQPEPILPEKYQLARAMLHWYCSTKLELSSSQKDEISASLGALIIELLNLGDSSETFPSLINLLEPFCLSLQVYERARAFDILNQLIQSDPMNKLKEQNLIDVGGIMALCLMYLTDTESSIELATNASLTRLLHLQTQLATGDFLTNDIHKIHCLFIEGVMENSNGEQSAVEQDKSANDDTIQSLSGNIEPRCLLSFIEKATEIIADTRAVGSVVVCNVLCKIFDCRHGELADQIDYIFSIMLNKYNQITNEDVLRALRGTFKQLSLSCSTRVFSTLMNFGVPFTKNLVTIIHDLADNRPLTEAVIAQIMECWSRSLPYEEKGSQRHATAQPLMALYLLNEWFQSDRMCDLGEYAFPRLFVALFIRMASHVDTLPPQNVPPLRRIAPPNGSSRRDSTASNASNVFVSNATATNTKKSSSRLSIFDSKSSRTSSKTLSASEQQQNTAGPSNNELKKIEPWRLSKDCMMHFLKVYKCQSEINDVVPWEKMNKFDTADSALEALAQGLARCNHINQKQLNVIIELLGQVLDGPYDIQRVCVSAFFAELIRCNPDDSEDQRFVRELIRYLLGRLVDHNIYVRKFCLRGLGWWRPVRDSPEDKGLPTTILASLISGLDDRDDKNDLLTLEAMCSLSNVIAVMNEDEVRPILMNVLLRIRPCFEKDEAKVRSAAFTLFGKMASVCEGSSREAFVEQIFSSLITLTLHLNDPVETVRESCKTCFQSIAPLLDQPTLVELFKETLQPKTTLQYTEFISDFAKILVQQYPYKVNFFIMNCIIFFKNPVPELRANAAIVAGYLIFNLTEEQINNLSKEHILNAFLVLLKDSNPDVRCRVAEAMHFIRNDDNENNENFVTIGTHFDPAEPTNSTSILATLGRKASKLVDLSSSNYGYDGKRFHGAFTGGFNAGFYNTVGSIEGWRPSEFKSSRTERAEKRSYEPEDFMDKGDFSEHGINPKQIKIRNMFDQNESVTRSVNKQPPGTSSQRTNEDILRDMIRVKTLSIGKKILMSMGWKPGEGVGVKMSRKHRQKLKWSLTQETPKDLPPSPPKSEQQQEQTPGVKVYGVAMPPPLFQQTITKTSRLDDDDNDNDDDLDDQIYANVSLPPLDYEVHFQLQKREHHGLGYKGLESLNLFGHNNLFVQPSIEKQISNVKIRGQAFGVGIEEDEDDRDLFAEDDLKQYDYELTTANDNTTDIMRKKTQENNFVLKFARYESMSMPVVCPPPIIPIDFRIGHHFPKSAMPPPPPPPPPETSTNETSKNESPKPPSIKHDANTRGLLLGDLSFLSRPPPNMSVPPSNISAPPPPPPQKVEVTTVKPTTIPTPSLEWDVEKERSSHTTSASTNTARTQFLDAIKNRFTSSSDLVQMTERQSLEVALESDLKKAVSMNLYGDLTRSISDWKPNPLLCKRMNVPNPYSDDAYDDSKESKKSRRQLCSNLFEHLFTQSSTESLTTSEQSSPIITPPPPSSSSSVSNSKSNETIISSSIIKPIIPPVQPSSVPKAEFASIESFEQENQERPPLDFFSAIFDNQPSDDDDADEQETEDKKNDAIQKPINPQSSIVSNPSITTRLASSIKYQSDHSDSSDSSIEEIEVSDKSSLVYGPAIPSNIPSRSKIDNDNSIWTKLANSSAQYEELKHKKKHKKKKKHHKKSKKHHHH